jgi:hypothetical protein
MKLTINGEGSSGNTDNTGEPAAQKKDVKRNKYDERATIFAI